jgi:hypothetical protein
MTTPPATPLAARRASPLLATALLMGFAACATTPAGTAAVQSAPLPGGDGAALGAWIGAVCDADPQTRTECREAAIVRIAETRGIGPAMEAVGHLGAADGEGHVLTHMIGIRGFAGAESAGEAFAACTPIHQSGCYHGVVQAYFGELHATGGPAALTTERLDNLCGEHRGEGGDRWLLFQCLHGMGHGVMLVHDNHLPRALEACDLLSSSWEREACYGGAFMESVMTVVAPHHDHVGEAAAGHGHGERHGMDEDDAEHHQHHQHHAHHAHHAHHEDHEDHENHRHDGHGVNADADAPFPALDPDDPHYPCNVLDARYQPACYDMQTAAMLHIFEGDIAATAAACRDAPDAALRAICHRSLGRDINAITYGVHEESAALCALASERYRPSCHVGVVKNVIDVTADAADGLAYCALVPEGQESEACYRAIGEQTVMLMADPADRRDFCEALPAEAREVCREGARVHLEHGPVPTP